MSTSLPVDQLVAYLTGAAAAQAPAVDALATLSDADFEAFVARTRTFAVDVQWLEQQARHCPALGRKLAVLNLWLEEVCADDRGYASGASSGGEGAARMLEINEPGFNPEADRIRQLIRKAILG
jgi:hypothetical protein